MPCCVVGLFMHNFSGQFYLQCTRISRWLLSEVTWPAVVQDRQRRADAGEARKAVRRNWEDWLGFKIFDTHLQILQVMCFMHCLIKTRRCYSCWQSRPVGPRWHHSPCSWPPPRHTVSWRRALSSGSRSGTERSRRSWEQHQSQNHRQQFCDLVPLRVCDPHQPLLVRSLCAWRSLRPERQVAPSARPGRRVLPTRRAQTCSTRRRRWGCPSPSRPRPAPRSTAGRTAPPPSGPCPLLEACGAAGEHAGTAASKGGRGPGHWCCCCRGKRCRCRWWSGSAPASSGLTFAAEPMLQKTDDVTHTFKTTRKENNNLHLGVMEFSWVKT